MRKQNKFVRSFWKNKRNDKPAVGNLEVEQKHAAVAFGETVVIDDSEQPRTPPVSMQEEKKSFFEVKPAAAPSTAATSSAAASAAMPSSGLDVPTTPRTSPTTRMHGTGTEEEHESKKARVEDVKRQRIERIVAEHKAAVRAVKVSENEVFHTMDDYETDLQMDDHNEIDVWAGEDEVVTTGMPEALWYDGDIKQHPPEPDQWVDRLADEVELQRLCSMGVLARAGDEAQLVNDKLTTKFVYDWRLKSFMGENGLERKRWLRRSRLVAREYAFLERRTDTYSPATSTHILNLLPLMYLQKCGEKDAEIQADSTEVTLACLDVKDAFLMVPQDKPVKIKVGQEEFIVKRNLPGQRMGAKNWYLNLRDFMEKKLQCKFCIEQPCLAKGPYGVFMLHVDDILFCGHAAWWRNVVVPEFQKSFTISWDELAGVGSSISFLKRKILKTEKGLALIPGTNAEKVVKAYEDHFGRVRSQTVPCDQSMQAEDLTDELSARDSYAYRSVVGICLYLARDRPDLLFPVKELSGFMSRPTHGSLQTLKKLIGYLKGTADYCVVLEPPLPGQGKWRSAEKFWVLESFTDADWSSNQRHRRSTSCGIHLVCGAFAYGSSRTQKVISLSSCESELHAMVSTLCDGIFLRRCLEFLTGAVIEHYLFTDSSSAKQLASRQGVGKVKHIAGKLLWIQDAVSQQQVALVQVPTLWNLSDIGTKPLGTKRLRLLLHELGVSMEEGNCIVGQAEYEEQSSRHGGGREVAVLAKNIARILVMMGLGPTPGAAMEIESNEQCNLADNMETKSTGHGNEMFWMVLILVLIVIAWAIFSWRLMKWLKQVAIGHAQLCLQVAELDAYAGGIRTDCDQVIRNSERLRQNMIRLENQQEMVSDGTDSLHYAVVELGGYVRHSDLTAQQRSHMYTQERGNMVAANAMGQQRYLQVIRQQSRGFAIGEDTDMEVNEGGESEMDPDAMDPAVGAESEGPWTPLITMFRGEINTALSMENFRDASELQRIVLIILDNLNSGNFRINSSRNAILNEISNRLMSLMPRTRAWNSSVADRYNGYAITVRQLMVTQDAT